MRTLRLNLAGTVMLLLLIGSAGAVVAQDAGDSEQVVSREAAVFDGTVPYPSRYLRGTTEELPGELKLLKRGDGYQFLDVELSDPRLSGRWRNINNEDVYIDAGGISVWTMARRIDNAEGSWVGHTTGYRDDVGRWHHQGTMTGSGAYEGLTAMVFLEYAGGTYHVHGMVFPGELPEVPEYPEPAE